MLGLARPRNASRQYGTTWDTVKILPMTANMFCILDKFTEYEYGIQKVVHLYGQLWYTGGMNATKMLATYLEKLAIEPEATTLYLELVKQGHSSALQLAKATKISRTQVYRHLETLQQNGLVSGEQLSYGTLYRALPLENIEGLLANREAETAAIRRNLSGMVQALQALAGGGGPKATVQHFYGIAGLKQVNWNLTKADKEYRVFEAAHLSQHLDIAFARRCRERCIERQLTSYDLTNATQITGKEIEPFSREHTFIRHIDPEVLAINFEVYIYNDVVALLDYSTAQQMAIEIHHPTLKTMMQQLFDAMWANATPLHVTS
jgi:sugar-specific transcriptional regulator TrmB